MEYSENSVLIRGELAELPYFSHENHEKRFFRFTLSVPRLSGTIDLLPVVAEEQLLSGLNPCGGDMIEVHGQVRSHNQRDGGIRRLLIFVFATSVAVTAGEPVNDVTVSGSLCRQPTLRRTPLGREICDAMLAVPRAFRRADYLPCILWGRTAQQVATCHTRDEVCIHGRLQSRIYTKQTPEGIERRTAYEISALTADVTENPM